MSSICGGRCRRSVTAFALLLFSTRPRSLAVLPRRASDPDMGPSRVVTLPSDPLPISENVAEGVVDVGARDSTDGRTRYG